MYKVFSCKCLWLMAAFILVLSHSANSQYYDLTVGTERHYASSCAGFKQVCLLKGIFGNSATEKVIDQIVVDGVDYAVVTLTVWAKEYGSEQVEAVSVDTSFYRMEGSVLYRYYRHSESAVFDFGFEKGDSVMTVLSPYVSEQEILEIQERYGVNQDGVASVILVDTLLMFSDGHSRNILWGDDSLQVGETMYAPPLELEFTTSSVQGYWFSDVPIPHNYNQFNRPFYYISGIGVIYTPYNFHGSHLLCGFKTPEGFHFGCDATQYASSVEKWDDIPSEMVLIRNYPNPFNPSTTINYTLTAPGAYRLLLYTASGSLIVVLSKGSHPQGEYNYQLDMSAFASGVYFIVLEQGSHRYTLPVTLIK